MLSSNLASVVSDTREISPGNLKSVNGQSLLGSGNISVSQNALEKISEIVANGSSSIIEWGTAELLSQYCYINVKVSNTADLGTNLFLLLRPYFGGSVSSGSFTNRIYSSDISARSGLIVAQPVFIASPAGKTVPANSYIDIHMIPSVNTTMTSYANFSDNRMYACVCQCNNSQTLTGLQIYLSSSNIFYSGNLIPANTKFQFYGIKK